MLKNKSYITYLLHSRGRHKVHSPFVFQFADTCLTAKVDKNFRIRLEKLFKVLKKDTFEFETADFGAGSKKKGSRRSVAEMLRHSSSKGLYGDVLWKISHCLQPLHILELGTNIGIGTLQLSEADASSIYTVEGCEQTQRAAMRTFDLFGKHNVLSFHDTFDSFLERPGLPVFDLVFLDGNHSGEATLRYLEMLERVSTDNTLFILDDIRWSDDMWSMWNTVCADDRYHVTIDLGRMGLLWKRPFQEKEHFVLRPKTLKTKLL